MKMNGEKARLSDTSNRVKSAPPPASPMRAAATAVALFGVVQITLFVQWSDLIVGGTLVAGPFPPIAASLLWAILVGVNVMSARLRGRAFFNPGELLLILAIWVISNMVAGRGMLHPMLASLVGPAWQARNSAMADTLAARIPDWLAITDKTAVSTFFEGHNAPVPWDIWWRPLLTWALFFVPFLTANVCLGALFERIWVRNERLAFPLVALPIETAGFQSGGLEPNKATSFAAIRVPFLIGLAFPVLFHGFGLANAYLPGIPCIQPDNDLSYLFASFPWNVICPVNLSIYPILIGLTFLAPADVTLGVWFFLLVNKMEMLGAALMGLTDGPVIYSTKSAPPFVEEQSAGAYLALGGMLVWHARSHLKKIIDSMWPAAKALETEYVVYRPLAWGFTLGVAGILIWSVVAGFPLWFAALYFGFYFTAALVLSRLMAEGGISWVLAPILPDKLILTLFGSAFVPPVVITRVIYSMQHLRDTRQMLAPAVFETGKLRDVAGIPLRRFYGLLLIAIALTLTIGTAFALPIFYRHGAVSLMLQNNGVTMSARTMPQAAVGQAVERLRMPVGISPPAAVAVCAGALVVCVLTALRLRFLWWPLHPLGYALTGTLQVGYANQMLFSIFAGWAFKTLTLRFGGMKGFRYMRGIAFGLIVGDLLMGGVVKLFDALLGPSGYALF